MSDAFRISLPPMECIAAVMVSARLGSFSAAAEELGLSPATVSRRAEGAEAWAGIKIFDRHGRGVRPTLEGQQLISKLVRALEGVNAVIDRERAPRRRPVVRVGVTPSFARFWLLPRLAALEGRDVTIEVVADLRMADLERGEVDLAIRYGGGGWHMEHEEPLFHETCAPYAKRAAFPNFATATPAEIAELPLLHNCYLRSWRAWASLHDVKIRRKSVDRVFADTGLVVDAALEGLGVGLWLSSLSPVEKAPKGLVVRSDLSAPSPFSYHLLMRAQRPGGAAEAVADRIRAAAGAADQAAAA
jgi:DNA-binding transcriptional LysR family regulator